MKEAASTTLKAREQQLAAEAQAQQAVLQAELGAALHGSATMTSQHNHLANCFAQNMVSGWAGLIKTSFDQVLNSNHVIISVSVRVKVPSKDGPDQLADA